MLADCLTKPMDSSFLRSVLQLGRFRIFDEQRSLQENANRKYGQRWMSVEPNTDSKRENSECESYDYQRTSTSLYPS